MTDPPSSAGQLSDAKGVDGRQAAGPGSDYLVVARRYRPQTFDQLIGQEHVSRALTGAISSGRVGHAYLFTGARGVGKTSAARILAKALNCAAGTSPTPCNQCEVCQGVSNGDDIDVLEIDGASNRGIDEIRQLRQNAAIRPSRSRFKIYIIDEVHMLTKEAFNALLKTLEEPPEHVKFIFATTEPNKIPVTILSRCQRYDFAGIDTAAIQTRLSQIAESEGVSIEPDALQILAMRASGSMRDSQSLLEQLLATASTTITTATVTTLLGIAPASRLSRLVQPLIDHDAARALAELDEAIAEGAEISQLVDQLLGYFRDVMTQSVGCQPGQMLYILPGNWDEARRIADQLGVQTLLAMVQILDQTAAQMRISTQTRTLAEMAIVRLCHLENLDALATLVDEIKKLPEGTQTIVPRGPSAQRTGSPSPTPGNLKSNKSSTRAEGSGSTRAEGSGSTTAEGSGSTTAEGSGSTTAEGSGSTTAEGSGSTRAEGSGSTRAEGSGSTTAEGSGSTTAEPASANGVQPGQTHNRPAPASALQLWQQALKQVRGLTGDQGALADQVSLTEDGRLVVRFPQQYSTCRDFCARSTNRERLEKALAQVAGEPVVIELKTHAQSPDSTNQTDPPQSQRQQLVEATQEAFVQRALELFDGDPGRLRYVPPEDKT